MPSCEFEPWRDAGRAATDAWRDRPARVLVGAVAVGWERLGCRRGPSLWLLLMWVCAGGASALARVEAAGGDMCTLDARGV